MLVILCSNIKIIMQAKFFIVLYIQCYDNDGDDDDQSLNTRYYKACEYVLLKCQFKHYMILLFWKSRDDVLYIYIYIYIYIFRFWFIYLSSLKDS